MYERPQATVVITTKDRKDDLRRALQSAIEQTASPEVLVIDDGSSDGTATMVQEEFPEVRLHREEEPAGLIVRRNQGAELARGPILFSIDDDAEFSSPHVVEQILSQFDDPRIGAIAIPYVDVRRSPERKQKAPQSSGVYCTSAFRGTAHALRKELFLELGGYREHFVHQGEEKDYCVRMLDAGHVVRLGDSDIIKHYESPKRSFDRMDYYGRRNEVLFAWHNVPANRLPRYLTKAAINTIRTAVRHKRAKSFFAGFLRGCRDCLRHVEKRAPVSNRAIQLYERYRRDEPILLREIRPHLPENPKVNLRD